MAKLLGFAALTGTYGLLIGLFLAWPDRFAGAGHYNNTVLMIFVSSLLSGAAAWAITGAERHWARAGLAGILTPFLAVLFGATFVSLKVSMPIAPMALIFVALPLSIPMAVCGAAYGFTLRFFQNTKNK